MSTKTGLPVSLLSLVIFSMPSCAGAETEDSGTRLRERTTHVRMRPEPVQWTPESVTVITAEELDATYRHDLEDLDAWAPGLIIDSLANTPRGAAIGIRGISSNEVSKGFQPAVPVIVDGVYLGTHTSQMQLLYDVEQIEIVRGPRGSLESAPSPGGAIYIRRTRPTGELELDSRASIAKYRGQEFNARLNFPITTSLAGKVTVSFTNDGGDFMDNIFIDRGDENENDSVAISTSFLWSFNDSIELQYTFDLVRDDSKSPALLNLSRPSDLVCITAGACAPRADPATPQSGSIDETLQNFSNDREFDGDHHTLRFNFPILNHTVTSITGLRRTDEELDQDLDATFVDFFSTSRDQDYDQFSQEFKVSSPQHDKFNYVVGAYFLKADYDRLQEDRFILKALSDAGLTSPRADGEIKWTVTEHEFTLQSYFGHLDYMLNDKWSADAGFRVSHVDKEFEHRPQGTRLNDVIRPGPLVSNSDDSNEISANVGLRYKVDEEAMLWFRYALDFRPGGFNEDAVSAESAFPFDAETTNGFDLGIKSEWFDDRLRLNGSYYRLDMDDKTERFATNVASGRVESVIDNVSSLDIEGYELEFEILPMANLYLRGAYSHISSDFDKFSIPGLAGQDPRDLTGLKPNRAPADSVSLAAQYSFPVWQGRVNTYISYRYTDNFQTNPRLPVAEVRNFDIVDASVSYAWDDWTFRVFVQNVNNKRFLQNDQSLSAADVVSLDPSTTSPQGLFLAAEHNNPRFTGFQIIYKPWSNN